MFEVGDIVALNNRFSHVGYVKQVFTPKGDLPTVIVEWFNSTPPFKGVPSSWHFENELTKVETTSETHEKK